MLPVAFDFDDVLVDSRAIVKEAYMRSGVREEAFPAGWYGTPGMQWLVPVYGESVAAAIYAAKRLHYESLMRDVTPLPAMDVARRLTGTAVVTAAPESVVQRVLDRDGLFSYRLFADCTREGKIFALRDMSRHGGVYVDDLAVGREIADAAGWSFIHYTGQGVSTLAWRIFRCL